MITATIRGNYTTDIIIIQNFLLKLFTHSYICKSSKQHKLISEDIHFGYFLPKEFRYFKTVSRKGKLSSSPIHPQIII